METIFLVMGNWEDEGEWNSTIEPEVVFSSFDDAVYHIVHNSKVDYCYILELGFNNLSQKTLWCTNAYIKLKRAYKENGRNLNAYEHALKEARKEFYIWYNTVDNSIIRKVIRNLELN
jgi:hypothetical protein